MLDGNSDPLQSPSKVNPSVPDEVSDVIMRAMQIRREERFDSAVIMRQVLRAAVNRSQEAAEDEERELAEAAAELKFAEKARQEQIQKLVEEKARELEEQKARELEEEKRRAAELLEQKLQEAEEMRLAAERRAAEAEQRLKEEEAARKAAAEAAIHSSQPTVVEAAPAPFEENLLELTVEPNSAVAAIGESEAVALDEAVLTPTVSEAVIDEEEPATAAAETAEPRTAEAAAGVSDSEATFSYEEAGSGSKMPMIIGAVVVLVIAAVGGWMFLGSGSGTAPQRSASQPAATQTAPPVAAPVAE